MSLASKLDSTKASVRAALPTTTFEAIELPLPATFVLASCGRVTFVDVDADFTRRAGPADVVAALEALRHAPAENRQTA